MSPDTDVYNIGLPLPRTHQKDIVVQLNLYSSKELKYIHLTAFLEVLQNDPNLSCIPAAKIPQIFQSLYVSTGCDYTFFSEIGKASFYRCLFQDAEFITSGNSSFLGSLADTNLSDNQFKIGFLALLRLIGSVYFRKQRSGFSQSNPKIHYCTLQKPEQTDLECHIQWLEDIRIKVSEDVTLKIKWYQQQMLYKNIGKGAAGYWTCGDKPISLT